MKIEVIDYDPEWARKFEELSKRLSEVVHADIISIEHVGSTSVVGLAAKPVIDLDIIVTRENVMKVIADLEIYGYKHRGNLGIEDREAFYNPEGSGSEIDHHLYVCVEGALALRNHLFLRDSLRDDAERMNAYGSLKKKLAAKYSEDINSYVEGKTQFILEILKELDLNEPDLESIREVNRNTTEERKGMTTIRRLNRAEGQLYKETRLAALKDSPEAFSSTYEDALKRTEQSWVEQADSSAEGSDRATFIAMEDHPIGLAAIYRDKDEPNVGELLQVWVAPEKRGGSAAYDLLNALMKWAISSGFSRVKAEVEISNLRALQFYKKFGFTRSTDMEAHSGSSVMLTIPIVSEIMKLSFLSEHPQHIAEIAKWYYDEWGDPDSSSGLDSFVEYVGKKAVSRMEIPLSFIAHDGDELLGAVELKFREHKGYPEYEHWLGSLYVGVEHRGSGVAAALIDCAKSHSACLKLEKLYLQCEPDLVKMYEKYGFQELHKARYGNLDTIIMVWNVS